jgi:hypothetical protein
MHLVGWIVRTEESGRVRYWKVGEAIPDRAARIAADATGAKTARAMARIASQTSPEFSVSLGVAVELWKRRPKPQTPEQSEPASQSDGIGSKTLGEITFDTVIREEDEMHIEGCYRLDGEDWKVFYFTHWHNGNIRVDAPRIRDPAVFQSGITGVDGVFPADQVLNKKSVMEILSEVVGFEKWDEVSGPNSLILK